MGFQHRLDNSSGELTELEKTQEPECQRSRDSEAKMQRKESVLIAPCGGSALASPAGLLLTAGLGSGPVPQVPRKNQRQQEKEGSAEEALSQKGESAGCLRMWTWLQVTGASPAPPRLLWLASTLVPGAPSHLGSLLIMQIPRPCFQTASSTWLGWGPGSSIFIGSSENSGAGVP